MLAQKRQWLQFQECWELVDTMLVLEILQGGSVYTVNLVMPRHLLPSVPQGVVKPAHHRQDLTSSASWVLRNPVPSGRTGVRTSAELMPEG